MVIQELDAELDALERSSADIAAQHGLEELRDDLEDELRFHQARFKELGRTASGPDAAEERLLAKRAIERIRGELKRIKVEYGGLREAVDRSFHPYWGSLLKQDSELSSFGQQVDTYADVYMRRVSCLRHYSPMQFFRSPYDRMPHEL
jgi:hypothetical protein